MLVVRLKNAYRQLSNSRVIVKRETDENALQHFEKFLNECLPIDQHESEFKNVITILYKNNPTSFINCVGNDQYIILLTDPRTIAIHFGIQDLIYVRWDSDHNQYNVEKNNRPITPRRFQRPTRGRGKGGFDVARSFYKNEKNYRGPKQQYSKRDVVVDEVEQEVEIREEVDTVDEKNNQTEWGDA